METPENRPSYPSTTPEKKKREWYEGRDELDYSGFQSPIINRHLPAPSPGAPPSPHPDQIITLEELIERGPPAVQRKA